MSDGAEAEAAIVGVVLPPFASLGLIARATIGPWCRLFDRWAVR